MNAYQLNEKCTYATPDEIDWLKTQAKQLPTNAEVVMIGAGPGVMAIAIMEERSDVWMTVIDNVTCEFLIKHAEQSRLKNSHLYCMIADSSQVEWEGQPIDLLIIDGDHSYEGVKADLDVWLQHVKPSGLIFLHDYDADDTCFAHQDRYPGVKQAVEECAAQWVEVRRVGTAIVMTKNILLSFFVILSLVIFASCALQILVISIINQVSLLP